MTTPQLLKPQQRHYAYAEPAQASRKRGKAPDTATTRDLFKDDEATRTGI